MKRYGQFIGIKEDCLEEYSRYHREVWPEIREKITECNIRNYSIYHFDGKLFAYFEYVGKDFDGDMAMMAADPKTHEWWDIVKPLQQPVKGFREGEWWVNMEELFHQD